MAPGRFRTAKYTRAWITGRHRCVEEEIQLDRGGTVVAGTLVHPDGPRRSLPAWIVLHGITRRGRQHAQLSRFTRAVVSTGAVAIVPEVPEWRSMSLAPRLAIPTIRAGIRGLRESGWARDAPIGVIGFSFGGPHAVSSTAHPDIRDDLAGAVAFGGYCDIGRTVRFLMTGTHEWHEHSYRLTPDPYGRWTIASNYLTAVAGHEDATDVADALRSLAQRAGDLGIPSLDPRLDAYKTELRSGVAEGRAELFDLFAPGSAILPDPERGATMAEALVSAAKRIDPEIDPQAALCEVTHPVHLLHGRRDHLIPFSESLRLRDTLPTTTPTRTTITRLFGHSAQDSFPSMVQAIREIPVFFSALRQVLRLV